VPPQVACKRQRRVGGTLAHGDMKEKTIPETCMFSGIQVLTIWSIFVCKQLFIPVFGLFSGILASPFVWRALPY
jgi:hypothetical protein